VFSLGIVGQHSVPIEAAGDVASRNSSSNPAKTTAVDSGLNAVPVAIDSESPPECQKWLESPNFVRDFQAQYSQDAYLFYNYYSFPPNLPSHKGFYIDLAAALPKLLSNTWFFEKCLGWSGLCIEAHPERAADLRKERSCTVVETCVTEKDDVEVQFSLPGGKGKNGFEHLSNGIVKKPGQFAGSKFINIRCKSLHRILEENQVKHVDFFSLDIEGNELPALKSVDWNNRSLDFLVAEMNDPTLKDWLLQHNFHYAGLTRGHWGDAVFVKNSDTWKIFRDLQPESARGDFKFRKEIPESRRKYIEKFLANGAG